MSHAVAKGVKCISVVTHDSKQGITVLLINKIQFV